MFPQPHQHLLFSFSFFHFSHCHWCEMVSHGLICIPLGLGMLNTFSYVYWPAGYLLQRNDYPNLSPFLNGLILLCNSSSYIFWIQVSHQIHDVQIFSHILNLLFYESTQVLQPIPHSGKKMSSGSMNYTIFKKSISLPDEEQLRDPQSIAWKGHQCCESKGPAGRSRLGKKC